MHPTAEALIQLQLDFIQQQLHSNQFIEQEVLHFLTWFKQQPVKQWWKAERLHALLQKPLAKQMADELFSYLQGDMSNPWHETLAHATLADVVPKHLVERNAQWFVRHSQARQQWIKQFVTHPAYTEMVSKLIQQSISDYVDHSMRNKIPSGVGSLMKMGRSVSEKATDSKMDDAVQNYLNKNLNKISTMSEKLLDQQFGDERVYQFHDKLWQRLSAIPFKHFIGLLGVERVQPLIESGQNVWNEVQQAPERLTELSTGLDAWLGYYQDKTWGDILNLLGLDDELFYKEASQLILPLLNQLIAKGYILERIRDQLSQFYNSAAVTAVLEKQLVVPSVEE